MAASRIGAIQLKSAHQCAGEWAQAEPDLWKDFGNRLNYAHLDYDPDLHREQISRYIEHLGAQLERAGEAGLDLVLLPECTLPLGVSRPDSREGLAELCRWAEPRYLERIAPIARRHQMVIASCYYRAEGDALYNDAVLVGETGDVIGIYHKVHLPCPLGWESGEANVFKAGDSYPVFDTRVGRVGALICYDIEFAEAAICLALQGVELILHPTVGYNFPDEEEIVAAARLRTRACDAQAALIYANFGPQPGRSAVYAGNGAEVACAGRGVDQLVFADLDLQARRAQDWGGGSKIEDHRDQLARKRRPETYRLLVEPRPPLLDGATGPDGRLYEYEAEVGLP
jgi:predicted amidohydrolase